MNNNNDQDIQRDVYVMRNKNLVKVLNNQQLTSKSISFKNMHQELIKKEELLQIINIRTIFLVEVSILKPHEATIPEKVMELLLAILKCGKWINPIIVHNKTFTIMDGHHRYKVALLLGLKFIPCYLLNYKNDVKVFSRRADYQITPNSIIQHSVSKKVYPYKTTRHVFCHKNRLSKLNLSIEKLS